MPIRSGERTRPEMLEFSYVFHSLCYCCRVRCSNVRRCAFASPIARKHFGATAEGREVDQIILTTDKGASASFITYGATLTRLVVPDRAGNLGDVVLGFDNLQQYEEQSPYFGAIVGRVANRIARRNVPPG